MAKKNYQSFEPCVPCATILVDRCYHHLRTQRSGGPDLPWNMISTCLKHHNQFHNHPLSEMCEKYPTIKKWLIENEWEFNTFLGKWVHPVAFETESLQ